MKSENFWKCSLLWIAIGVLGRIIPHYPNATPLMSLCFFSSLFLTRSQNTALILATLMISDSVLAYLNHYPFFGSWSIFTYSAFLMMVCYPTYSAQPVNYLKTISITGCFALFFWVWTNFGVWLTASFYPHTLTGLITCYSAALPFLRNSLISTFVWSSVLYLGLFYFSKDYFKAKVVHKL